MRSVPAFLTTLATAAGLVYAVAAVAPPFALFLLTACAYMLSAGLAVFAGVAAHAAFDRHREVRRAAAAGATVRPHLRREPQVYAGVSAFCLACAFFFFHVADKV